MAGRVSVKLRNENRVGLDHPHRAVVEAQRVKTSSRAEVLEL